MGGGGSSVAGSRGHGAGSAKVPRRGGRELGMGGGWGRIACPGNSRTSSRGRWEVKNGVVGAGD